MKINDVLECVNKTLEFQRRVKNIVTCSHFVTHTKVEKLIGNYRGITTFIDFFNGETTIPVVKVSNTVQGSETEPTELQALQYLINILANGVGPLDYKQFLEGTYAGIE